MDVDDQKSNGKVRSLHSMIMIFMSVVFVLSFTIVSVLSLLMAWVLTRLFASITAGSALIASVLIVISSVLLTIKAFEAVCNSFTIQHSNDYDYLCEDCAEESSANNGGIKTNSRRTSSRGKSKRKR